MQPMPLAVHRRDDGALVWSGSDVVFGDVTRANPNFTLFAESLVRRVLVEDGRAAGVGSATCTAGASTRCAPASSSSPPTRCARRSCCGPPASGRRRWAATSTTSRRSCSPSGCATSSTPPGGARPARRPGDQRAERRQLGARSPTTQPFHGQVMQLDASPGAAGRGRRPGARVHRRPGLVLREGPAGVRPRRVLRRRDRRLRHAGDADPLPAHRARPRDDDRRRARRSCARPGARRAARRRAARACRPAPRCTTRAPPAWAPPTTAPRSAPRTARSGASPACTSPATASSPPPPPATRR